MDSLRIENNNISEFAQKHSNENGYTDIYTREDGNRIEIAQKKIRFDKIDLLLINLGMRRIENVYYFYGSTREKCQNTIAYELKSAEIFIMFENNFVKNCFINGFRFHKNEDDKLEFQRIFSKIGTEFSLILNDWDLTKVIDLEDQNEIKKYLNEGF